MSTRRTILVVDDDPHIRQVVSFALSRAGFDTVEASDGRAAIERFAQTQPDLIVLDVLMPELDGTDVCRTLRAQSKVPIVFLSSRDDEIDRILGLEMGGDDYVTKPFSPRELVARVRAVLRRVAPAEPVTPSAPRVLSHGPLQLDLDRFKVFWGTHELTLTATEFGVIRTLLNRPGKVYSRAELMAHVYGDDTVVSDRTIDSHVRRVRQKFEAINATPIKTIHGVGYTLNDSPG